MDFSNPDVVKTVISSGIFGVLFVSLLWWILREQKARDEEARSQACKREERLMSFVESISPVLTQIKDEIRANTAICTRLETKVDGCDDRRSK